MPSYTHFGRLKALSSKRPSPTRPPADNDRLSALGLPKRIVIALRDAGIETVRQARNAQDHELLLRTKNFGRTSLAAVRALVPHDPDPPSPDAPPRPVTREEVLSVLRHHLVDADDLATAIEHAADAIVALNGWVDDRPS